MDVLVDTSFWIDFGRGKLNGEERKAIGRLLAENRAILYQFVWLELVVGFRSPTERRLLKDCRAASRWSAIEEEDARKAEGFVEALRPKGVIVSASDLLIAAAADRLGAKLLHHDADFSPLLERHPFSHLRMEIPAS